MLKIKLAPHGKKHQRTFRLVVAEQRSKSDGKVVDTLGFYTPQTKTLEVDKEKLQNWQKNGALLTLGVDKLFNPDKYPPKPKKKNLKAEPKAEAPKEVETKKEVKEEISKETPKEAEVKEEIKEEVREEVRKETPKEVKEETPQA